MRIQVQPNENTSDIARRLGVTNQELVSTNGIKPFKRDPDGHVYFASLKIGESLVVPVRARARILAAQQSPGRAPSQGDIAVGICNQDQDQIFPGVCVPKKTTTADKPQGPCPPGFVMIAGVCLPKGTSNPWSPGGGGGENVPQLPCPPGFTQAGPGVCLPPGTPVGTSQGPCPPGSIEVVPGSGICVDKNSVGNDFPSVGCRDDEYMASDGYCYCKPGTVRADPNDVNSSCVPAGGTNPDQPTGNNRPTVEQCQQQYGAQSWPMIDPQTGQWTCNVCGPNEVIDPGDGYCMCRPGYHRQIPGDGSSPCVPDDSTQIPEGYTKTGATNQADCKSPNIWIEGKGCFAPPAPAPIPPKPNVDKPTTEDKKEGLSTGAMVGIGAAVIASLGVIVAMSRSSAAGAATPSAGGAERQSNPHRLHGPVATINVNRPAAGAMPRWEDPIGQQVEAWFASRGFGSDGGGTSLDGGGWDMVFIVPQDRARDLAADLRRDFSRAGLKVTIHH